MKKLITLLLAVAGMVSTASATDYSIGADEGGWKIKGQMTDNEDGTYTYIINFPANYDSYYFTIFEGNGIAESWSNAYRPTGSSDWGLDANNTPTMSKSGTGVLYYPVSSTIARAIKVDFTPSTGACTVTRLIAVASGYNGWSTETDYLEETSRGSNVYEGSATLQVETVGKDNGFQFVGIYGKKLEYYSYKNDNGEWIDANQANALVSLDGVYNLTANFSDYKWVAPEFVSVNASAGSYGMATLSSEYALDFTNVSGITAYKITGVDNPTTGELAKTQITGKVPAGTGLYIEGTSASIPTTICTDVVTGNLLKAQLSEKKISKEEDDNTNFILTVNTVAGNVDTPKFYKVNDAGNTVSAGKAYLQLPTSTYGSREYVWFDAVTAIDTVVEEQTVDGQAFNLAGQRVSHPVKGLYIVNGKKIIKK